MTTKGSNNPFPSVLLNEVATDGSDTPTPAADYRRLFLGEDGELHLIDSADVVTDVSGGFSGDAGDVPFTPAGTIAATDVQAAIEEVSGDVTAVTHGAWTDYTPTWAASGGGAVLGSSTLLGRYKLLDSKTGIVKINFTITTGGAFNTGTGTWTFTLPSGWTTPNDGRNQILACEINDASTTHYAAVAKISPNDTKTTEIHVADDATPRVLDHNSPVTWATGDSISIMGIVEIQ